MKIVQLKSENVKRISAVEITPDGNVVVVGGKNGAGKSSVLDSIQWALGGEPGAKMPVRKGEEKARIIADLGDLVVTRTITQSGGGSLVVKNADGVRQISPQTILDKLVGKLTFDPLEFSRQKPKQQADTLRALVGLDFDDHDAKRERIFEQRTAVNRECTSLKNRLDAMPKHEGVPDAEQSVADVMAAQSEAVAKNASNAAQRKSAERARDDLTQSENLLTELQRQADELAERIKKGKVVVESRRETFSNLSKSIEALKDIDLSQFKAKLHSVEAVNAAVRSNAARSKIVTDYKSKTSESEKLTAILEAMDSEKRAKINSARYPIDGLAFDTAGGVTLGGIPFEQCSSAEQLKVSVAIGLALNPKLRVLLIRDGSLLDSDSLQIVVEMAKTHDAQVWIERVGEDESTSVVIEDGRVKEQEIA